MEFSRQGYWSGLPCPPPGDLPSPGIEPESLASLALADSLPLHYLGSPNNSLMQPYSYISYLLVWDWWQEKWLSSPTMEEIKALNIGKIYFTKWERQKPIFEIYLKCGKSLQSHPPLCDPMDCSLPGSSVHGISQARMLEWVAISSSKGSSWPRDQTHISYVSCIGRQVLYY